MLESINSLDKQILIFLNNLGSSNFDALWLFITKQANWTPFFLLLLYLLQRKFGWKKTGIVILFIALILTCCNTTVELFKSHFQRLRPCNEPTLKGLIRVVHQSDTFSFFSGHAANSLACMTFLFLSLKKFYTKSYLIFLYPLIFAYSRIYLGVHYPSDILTGYFVGLLFGILFFKLYEIVIKKYID